MVNGPELVTKYLGDSESMLRRLFARARTHDRAIIFFDEIDSIASRRDANSHEASNRLVTQFLTEMDGYEESDRVIVIGATNRVGELILPYDDLVDLTGRLNSRCPQLMIATRSSN